VRRFHFAPSLLAEVEPVLAGPAPTFFLPSNLKCEAPMWLPRHLTLASGQARGQASGHQQVAVCRKDVVILTTVVPPEGFEPSTSRFL
jgi:hypothetical protein